MYIKAVLSMLKSYSTVIKLVFSFFLEAIAKQYPAKNSDFPVQNILLPQATFESANDDKAENSSGAASRINQSKCSKDE